MTNKQILSELRLIFSSAKSPGEAFDAILRLRNADVTYDSIASAFRDPNQTSFEHTDSTAKPADVLFFGKYRGKPLAEVAATDPSYLRWAIENATCIDDKWRAKLEKALEEQGEELDDDCLSKEL